ncbi:unnamed protein product [Didymodactylos carnosus]|uniref:Ice-binding protein n=1 Tax=Didymodactylos carnosus TaxID=1234261 RepID=A0A816AKZ3_9BILA|nr:unnamed protein product [Didymodactylos carnosus]CAF1598957.1 unnamed protein product [Didymodactylos carnosus]CAF4141501.1 unnamed protein product [Didymodactylos carnosus]CAF4475314.1 unnamed protein product [Didymodactylos carnosus]
MNAFLIFCCILFSVSYSTPLHPCVQLASAKSFALLVGITMTNAGATVVRGNLGLSPGTSVTAFPSGIVSSGTQHVVDTNASQAQADLVAAYNQAFLAAKTQDLSGVNLCALVLHPGVYKFDSSAFLTSGNLTLTGGGVYIFQTSSTLITFGNSNVLLKRGAKPGCVFWQVGSSATLGSGTNFQGNIMATTSITFNSGANLKDSTYAINAAITLIGNHITRQAGCTLCERCRHQL